MLGSAQIVCYCSPTLATSKNGPDVLVQVSFFEFQENLSDSFGPNTQTQPRRKRSFLLCSEYLKLKIDKTRFNLERHKACL